MLRSLAVSAIACAAVVVGAASAQAEGFSASAGLRGSLSPSLGVILIYMERPHDSVCPQIDAPSPSEVSDRSVVSVPDQSTGSSRLDLGTGGDGRHEGPQIIPAALGDVLQNASLNSPGSPDIQSVGFDLQSAYRALASAGCEAADIQMTPFVRVSAAATPEPATWALLILGVAMTGTTLRARRPRAPGEASPA